MTFAWEPAPVVGGAYTDDTRPWSVQDTVNWIPVKIERDGGRSDSLLRCAPGASVFCIPGPVQPVRGLHDVEGKLFAVVGTGLFQITPTGVAIPHGTIPGVRRVSMTHNQITGGNEIVIANGLSGYVYNTKTETLVQITDDGFPGFKVCDYVDGYIAGVEPQGRFWFISDLAAATSYNTLDRTEAESQPDRIVGLIVSHREVFVLGERTGEFFRNTGAATGTFQRADGTEMEIGCASADSICKLDNSVFWLGNDGSVYRLNGYQPVRISTRPLEQAISRCNMAEAFAFTYEDRGHKIYYLTFPDGMTWGYDVSTGEWSRRQSFGFDRWRMNCMVRWNKQWIAGDFVNGKLYRLEWDQPWENGEVIERRRTTGVLHGNQNRITLDAIELVFATGADDVGPGELFPDQPAGPSISGDAPYGIVGEAYAGYAYTLTPGDTPIVSVSVVSGAIPSGLSISSAGVISTGSPTVAGSNSFRLRVTDQNGLWAELSDTIDVYDMHDGYVACGIDHTASGGVDFPYSKYILLGPSKGSVSVSWDFGIPDKAEVWIDGILRYTTGYRGLVSEQGNLNSWLDEYDTPRETVNPDDPGSTTFYKSSASPEAELRVYGPIPATLWEVNVGCPNVDAPAAALSMTGQCPDPLVTYTTPFAYAANGGTEPYTFSIVSGALPSGRTLNTSTGVVTGTYTTTGTYAFTVRVTDALGAQVDVADSVTVLAIYP